MIHLGPQLNFPKLGCVGSSSAVNYRSQNDTRNNLTKLPGVPDVYLLFSFFIPVTGGGGL
jgi:hypothetical protein